MAVVRAVCVVFCLGLAGCGGRLEYPEPERDATLDQILTPVPEPFRNVWAVAMDDCPRPDGKTRISIDPASITFPEGRFDVLKINQPDRDNILLDVRFAGGPLQTHILHLSDTMDTLNYTGPGILRTYHRCNAW